MRRSERVDPATKERLLQRRLKAEAEKKALAKSLAMALDDEEEKEEEEEEKDSILINRRKSNEKKRKRSTIEGNKDIEEEEEEEEIEKVENDDICGSRKFMWLTEPIRQTESGTRYFSGFILGGVVYRLGDWVSVASGSSSEKRKGSTDSKKKKRRNSSTRMSSSSSSSISSFCPGRLESIWAMNDGTKMCALSWCYLPSETAVGKTLTTNGKFEVFISSHAEGVEIAAIERRAKVLSLQQWKTRIYDAADMRRRNTLRFLSFQKKPAAAVRKKKEINDEAKSPSPSRRSGRLTPSMPTPTIETTLSVSKLLKRGEKDGKTRDKDNNEEEEEEICSEDEGDYGDRFFKVDPSILISHKDTVEEVNEEKDDNKEEDNEDEEDEEEEKEEEEEEEETEKTTKKKKTFKKRSSMSSSKSIVKKHGQTNLQSLEEDRSHLRIALYWTRYFFDFGTKQIRTINQNELESLTRNSSISMSTSTSTSKSIKTLSSSLLSSSIENDVDINAFPLALKGHALTQQGFRSGPLPGLGIGLGVTSGTGAFTGAHTISLVAGLSGSSTSSRLVDSNTGEGGSGGGIGVTSPTGLEGEGLHRVSQNRLVSGFGGALTGGDIFKRASKQLALSSAPPSMPCREGERKQLLDILDGAIRRGGLGQALYVSGMPGMGKTATMTEVVRELQSRNAQGDLPDFNYVEVNAMKLSTPPALYTVLHRALTGAVLPPARACAALDARFSTSISSSSSSSRSTKNKKKKAKVEELTTLLLVDELDFCVTRKQQVLYNLFEWPTRPGARLIVVGIANVQDMPERLLPKVASRLGLGRITFTAYTAKQIETIVTARLQGIPAFSAEAVTMCAKKVCNSTGDVRRALHMCRRAVEIAKARVEAAEAAGLLPKGSSVGLVLPKTTSSTSAIKASSSSSSSSSASGVKASLPPNSTIKQGYISNNNNGPPTSPILPPSSSQQQSTTTSTKAALLATPLGPTNPLEGLINGVVPAPPPIFSPASLNNPLAIRVTLDDLKAAASEISASVAQRAIGQTAPFERFLLVMLAEGVKRANNNAEPRHLGELLIRGKALVKMHCRAEFDRARAKEAAITAAAAKEAVNAGMLSTSPIIQVNPIKSTTGAVKIPTPTAASFSSSSASTQLQNVLSLKTPSSSSVVVTGTATPAATKATVATPGTGIAPQRLSLSDVKAIVPSNLQTTSSPSSISLYHPQITTSPASNIALSSTKIVQTVAKPFAPSARWEAAQRAWNDDSSPSLSPPTSLFRAGPKMISITAYNPFPTAHDLLSCAFRLDALKLIVCEWPRPGADPPPNALWDGKSYEEAKYKFGGGESERVILPPEMPFVSFGCIQPDDILLVLNEDPLVRTLREGGVL